MLWPDDEGPESIIGAAGRSRHSCGLRSDGFDLQFPVGGTECNNEEAEEAALPQQTPPVRPGLANSDGRFPLVLGNRQAHECEAGIGRTTSHSERNIVEAVDVHSRFDGNQRGRSVLIAPESTKHRSGASTMSSTT